MALANWCQHWITKCSGAWLCLALMLAGAFSVMSEEIRGERAAVAAATEGWVCCVLNEFGRGFRCGLCYLASFQF